MVSPPFEPTATIMNAIRCSHCTDSHHHHPKHDQPQPPNGSFAAMARRNPPKMTTIPSCAAPSPSSSHQQTLTWLNGSVRLNWSRTPSGRRWTETDDDGSCQHISSDDSTPPHHLQSTLSDCTSHEAAAGDQYPHLGASSSCCPPNESESHHNDQTMDVATAGSASFWAPNDNADEDLRKPSNPLTELKRSRTTRRDSVRRSSHRSVWWASGFAHLLVVLCVLVVGGGRLWPIRGVEAGMEVLDRHLRDLTAKVPHNHLPNGDGSE